MQEVKWWVIILFMIVCFDRLSSILERGKKWFDERGNGIKSPVTLSALRQTLGLKPTGDKTFLELAQETHQARFDGLIGSVNALTQINGRLLDQIRELVALEKARIEFRQQGE